MTARIGRKTVDRILRDASARTEREIQTAILEFLSRVPGVVAWKSGTGSFRASYKGRERFIRIGLKGCADIIGWQTILVWNRCDGAAIRLQVARFLAIEVKKPGEPLRPEQAAFLERATRDGALAFVAHSVADVAHALNIT